MHIANLLSTFGQTYYTYSSNSTSSGLGTTFWVIYFTVVAIIVILTLAGMWKLYKKAGRGGWEAIIPIYSTIVLLKIVRRPLWWVILFFIPIVNFVFGVIVNVDLAKAYGKGVGMAILIIFFPYIGLPILGFGDSTYQLQDEMTSPVNPTAPTPPTMPTLS